MPSVTPLKNVWGVCHRPSIDFSPPSNPAHAHATATATGTCVAMSASGRRIRTAHAAKAHTGAVNNAHDHQPVNCHARIQLQECGSALLIVWKCIWIANRSANADQATNTMSARFMCRMVASYEKPGGDGRPRRSEMCEFHMAVTCRLFARRSAALRLGHLK